MSDHFDGRRFVNPTGTAGQPFSKVPRMLREPRTPWPTHIEVRPQMPPALDGAAAVVTFIGHATFLIQTAAGNILTDPMYSDRASPLAWAGPRRVRSRASGSTTCRRSRRCCSATTTTITAICRRCGARTAVRSGRGDADRQRTAGAIGGHAARRGARLVAARDGQRIADHADAGASLLRADAIR